MARPLILPCCEKSLCSDPGTPILNLSAELDDGPSWLGANYNGQTPRRIGERPGTNPPPPGFCISQESQTVADQCAQRDQVNNDDPGGPGPDAPPRFGNQAQSCTVTCPDGLPFSYTVAAGTYLGFSQILVDRAALSFACSLARANRVCLSDLQDFGCLGEAYSDTIIPLGTGPFTFSIISGSLPPGLTMTDNGAVATIAGTPTSAGIFTLQVRVTGANGNFMQRTYQIAVIGISNSSLPDFTIGVPYSQQLNAVGGTAPYSFEVTEGLFPDGITMSDTGLISGTPTEGGDFPITVTVTDGDAIECPKDLNLHGAAVAPSYSICNWPYVLSQLSFVGCDPSIFPAWDGIFNKQTVSTADGGKIFYFIDQSINGNKVAASETANYPNGNWTIDCFAQVHYDPGAGSWFMPLNCTNCNVDWVGELHNNDPDNPEGVYTMVFGSGPATIQLVKVGAPAGPIPNWSQLLWGAPTLAASAGGTATFSPASATGAAFDSQCTVPDLSNAGAAASSQNIGTLNYSGPAQNCNLAVTWDTDPQSVFGGHGFVKVEQIIGITTFVLTQQTFAPLFQPDGVYNLPFTLLNTAGCTWQLKVTVTTDVAHLIGAPAVPGLSHLIGTITNV